MVTTEDRRDKMSLDRAYDVYFRTIKGGGDDLFAIVQALKTVQHALDACQSGGIKLTERLWKKIQQALFDKLLTGHSNYLCVFDGSGVIVESGIALPDFGIFEIHPEGLRRDDDFFRAPIEGLHELTVMKVSRAWSLHGSMLKHEYFVNLQIECSGDACLMPPGIVFGHERLREETEEGRRSAYTEWWDLYWRAYCTPDEEEKEVVLDRMAMLEAVWGRLSSEQTADVA